MEVQANGWVAWKEPRSREAKGALQACRERHARMVCARCCEPIEEYQIMYSRTGNRWFCSTQCDQADMRRHREDEARSEAASQARRQRLIEEAM